MANRPSRGSEQTLQSLNDVANAPRAQAGSITGAGPHGPTPAEASGARAAISGERTDAIASSGSLPGIDCLSPELIDAMLAGMLEPAERLPSYDHLKSCQACVERLTHAGEALFGAGSLMPGCLVARRYRIIRFVAQGGMGEVYEAYDTELSVRVALKMVPATGEQKAVALRALTREVLLARSIAHPNVCRIFDLGLHDAGLQRRPLRFLTMEFVDGERLTDRVVEGPLELDLVRSIARDLLLGLAAAHRAGVLHRDFKSDNVLLREGSGHARAVIMDFGLARSLAQHSSHFNSANHRVEGSLHYMAPEQLKAQPLGWETDIYAFGVVLFEMLTGRTPFQDQTTLGAALQRCAAPPPRPSAIVPKLSPALDRVVQRCLAPKRADRYASADAAFRALEEAFAPVTPRWTARIWGRVPVLLGFLTLAGLGVEGDQLSLAPRRTERALSPTPPSAALVVARETATTTIAAEQATPSVEAASEALGAIGGPLEGATGAAAVSASSLPPVSPVSKSSAAITHTDASALPTPSSAVAPSRAAVSSRVAVSPPAAVPSAASSSSAALSNAPESSAADPSAGLARESSPATSPRVEEAPPTRPRGSPAARDAEESKAAAARDRRDTLLDPFASQPKVGAPPPAGP